MYFNDFFCFVNVKVKLYDRKEGNVEYILGRRKEKCLERNGLCFFLEVGGFCVCVVCGFGM